GIGTIGIQFNSAKALNVQNCVIHGFAQRGMNLTPSAAATVNVSDTTTSGNGLSGIVYSPTGSSVFYLGTFERLQALANGGAGLLLPGSNATAGFLIAT